MKDLPAPLGVRRGNPTHVPCQTHRESGKGGGHDASFHRGRGTRQARKNPARGKHEFMDPLDIECWFGGSALGGCGAGKTGVRGSRPAEGRL
jgi:hypothetical protein